MNAPYPFGSTQITWAASDAAGNESDEVVQTVTVTDTEAPEITAPANISIQVGESEESATDVDLGTPSTSDNCGVEEVSNDALTTFPVGTTTVIWTVTDVNGNTATANQTVTVTREVLPTITAPANITVNNNEGICGATGIDLGSPAVTGEDIPSDGISNNAPASFPVGTTTVIWTVTDGNGNTAAAQQSVTVTDEENPVIAPVAIITRSNDPGSCDAEIEIDAPAVSDNCDNPTATGTRSDGLALNAPYPVGSTQITWVASDAAGNEADEVVQTVTVTDTEAPEITAPANISIQVGESEESATDVDLGIPSTSDNCGVEEVSNDAAATFAVGTTTVTWTVTDVNGNEETAQQTVTVTKEVLPTITAPANITVSNTEGICGATGIDLGSPAVTGEDIPNDGITNDALSTFPVGTNTVFWTVTDGNGNTATATQSVTVTDEENPVIAPVAIITRSNDPGSCDAEIEIDAPAVSDNCDNPTATGTRSDGLALNAPYPVGTTQITWAASDAAGNEADEVVQTVTVTDTEAPEITAPANISIQVGESEESATDVDLGTPTTSDNCGVEEVTNDAAATFAVGTTTVTWTGTDVNGNEETAQQTVTVTRIILPSIPAPNDIEIDPTTSTVPFNEEICVTATVLDQFGEAMEGVEVFLEINGQASGSAITDEEGVAEFCKTFEIEEQDGQDGDGLRTLTFYYAGGTRVNSVVTLTRSPIIVIPVPTLIRLAPVDEDVIIGEQICFDLEVLDQFDMPLGGADFFIELDGNLVDDATSGQDGKYQYCFSSTTAGQFNVGFYIEGGVKVFSVINVTEIIPIPTTMNVSLSEEQIQVGEELCLAVTVLDQFGLPVVGADVALDVNGVFYGRGTTDENGRLDFCITPDEAGMIVFEINLDDLQETASILVTDEPSEDIAIKAFALVDADKNQIIREIKEGDVLLYSEIKDLSLNFVAIADPEIVGSVWIEMESRTRCETCPTSKTGRVETVIPYALFGDFNSNYNGRKRSSGEYTLYAKPYAGSNRQGEVGMDHTVNFTIKYDVEVTSFVLVDSHTNQDVQEIRDGDVLDLAKLGDIRFNIRSEADMSPIGAMTLEIEGPINFNIFERVAPYALFGDSKGNYAGRMLPVGKYTLKARAFPNPFAANSGFGGEIATIHFEVISGIAVTSYTLVNADTNEDLMELNDQDVLDLNKYGTTKLSIRANTVGDDIQSVVMMLSGPIRTTIRERVKPYALFGDLPVNHYIGRKFQPGDYELTSTPYDRNNMVGGAKTIRFTAKYGENLRVAFAEQVLEGKEIESEDALESGKITIYPQPSNGVVNFKYPSELAENTSVQIIDSNGRIIYGGVVGKTPAFDFRNYGSGLYLLIIHAENESMRHKIIIH